MYEEIKSRNIYANVCTKFGFQVRIRGFSIEIQFWSKERMD